MSDSLFSDLTDVQLIAKEQHRRKRRLTKLNKSKRQRLLSQLEQNGENKYNKSEEWHSNKHHKYKKNKTNQEWVLNIYLECTNNNNLNDDTTITNSPNTTITTTVIIDDDHDDDDDNDNDYYDYYYSYSYYRQQQQQQQQQQLRQDEVITNNISQQLQQQQPQQSQSQQQQHLQSQLQRPRQGQRQRHRHRQRKETASQESKQIQQTQHKLYQETEEEDEDEDDISISTCFDSIEYDFYSSKNSSKKRHLEFPSTFIYHITSLYESSSSEQNDINGLLNSARSWNNEYGQVVVIGTYLDELIKIFKENTDNIPTDLIYTISEFTGNAIVWLRRTNPGLNIFKWSVNTKIDKNRNYEHHDKYEHDDQHYHLYQDKLKRKRNLRKWKFKINNALKQDEFKEFFFSGYIGNDTMKELLLLNSGNNRYNQYLDLDWCFVAFLLLGLVPKYENSYFKWYFNQKLLSALPPTFPFKYLLKQ